MDGTNNNDIFQVFTTHMPSRMRIKDVAAFNSAIEQGKTITVGIAVEEDSSTVERESVLNAASVIMYFPVTGALWEERKSEKR